MQVTPASYRVRASPAYTMAFTLLNALPLNGQISVTLPSDMSLSTCTSISGLKKANPTLSKSSQTLTISNPGAYTSGERVSLTIGEGCIVNPTSEQETGVFTISTADSNGKVIDSNNTVKVKANANEIPVVEVSACEYTSMQCTYKIKVGLQGMTIVKGSYIEVDIPSEVGIVS